MQVTIRMVGVKLPAARKNLPLELEEGATVGIALEKVSHLFFNEMSPEDMDKKVVLVNNKQASRTDSLSDGDHIHILHVLTSG